MVDWTWTFMLEPVGADATRLHFRCRARAGPRWLAVLAWLTIVPADFVMARQMLRGITRRARPPIRAFAAGHR